VYSQWAFLLWWSQVLVSLFKTHHPDQSILPCVHSPPTILSEAKSWGYLSAFFNVQSKRWASCMKNTLGTSQAWQMKKQSFYHLANLRSTKPESGFGIEKAPNSVRAPGSHTWYRICNRFLLSGMKQLVNLYIAEI
jgi:hypothetical protein